MSTSLNEKYKPDSRWKAVVDHDKGILVVNAGPGTGKTWSLIRKVEALLARGVESKRVYYLTFVNSIVEAFAADVAKPVDKGGLGRTVEELGLRVSTLHSLAFKVLRTHHENLRLPEELQMVSVSPRSDKPISSVIIEDLAHLVSLDGRHELNRAIDRLFRIWQEGRQVPAELTLLEDAFSALLQVYHVLPWERAVPLAITAIERHGLPSWLAEPTHFLVDEFQDFNPSEQRFIEKISQPSDSVIIVGDVDQSIYGGRAASPAGLEALLARDDVIAVNFVLCRRCPKAVIAGANKILREIDPDGWERRRLEPCGDAEGNLKVQKMKSCKAEVASLAMYLKKWIERGEKSIAVLFPTRKALRFYEEKFIKAGISCDGGGADVDDLERVVLELAAGATQPFLERVLLSTYKALERRYGHDVLPMVKGGTPLREALKSASETKTWRKDTREALEEFEADLQKVRSGDLDEILSVCDLKGIAVNRQLLEAVLRPIEGKTPRERVQLALDVSRDASKEAPAPVVRLLTMHSAKGLTVPIAVLPACEDKWIPGAAEGEALEEKRRLFYVALTRAEKGVLITYPETRAKKDPLNHAPKGTREGISRFAERVSASDGA